MLEPTSALARLEGIPALARIRAAVRDGSVYAVGGCVRDLLLDRDLAEIDLDIAVEGDAIGLARSLGQPEREHPEFGTATVIVDGTRIDLTSTRSESYAHPGALPEVSRPAPLAADLARRDFTVNAMALGLEGRADLIDPHDGATDLEARSLRVLHPGSFTDDPTRALRAARYAARLGFELEAETARLLADADLTTVSEDRVEAELRRTASEAQAAGAFELLAAWGLAGVDSGAPGRIEAVIATLGLPGWGDEISRVDALVGVARLSPEIESAALRIAAARPARPSEAAELVAGRTPLELVAARTAGAAWLDDWIMGGRDVRLEITGEDLMAAGMDEGPALGRALAAAMRAKRDGEAPTRDDELRIALATREDRA